MKQTTLLALITIFSVLFTLGSFTLFYSYDGSGRSVSEAFRASIVYALTTGVITWFSWRYKLQRQPK